MIHTEFYRFLRANASTKYGIPLLWHELGVQNHPPVTGIQAAGTNVAPEPSHSARIDM